jgi:hypothetical protein
VISHGHCGFCVTLNITGWIFEYGQGRTVRKACHMVLGLHTETGQPTLSGSGRPTLQHRKDPGPSTGLDRERANAATEKYNPWRSSYERVIGRKLKGPLGVESRDRGIGAGLFPEAWPRGTTPRVWNRFIVADGRRPEAILLHPRLSGDTRDHATSRILAFDTRLWR